MIFCNKGCGIFAVILSMLTEWIRAGLVFQYDPPPDQRAEILKNATTEFLKLRSGLSSANGRPSALLVAQKHVVNNSTIRQRALS